MNRITIKARLFFLVFFLSALLILIGILGLRNASQSNIALEMVYRERVVSLRQLKIISDMYAVNIVDSAHKSRNQNIPFAEALNQIDIAGRNIQMQWEAYLGAGRSEEETQLIQELTPLMRNADQSLTELRSLLQKEDRVGLADYTTQRLYPAIDPVTAKISKLIDLQLDLARAQYEQSTANYRSTQNTFIALIVTGIAIGFIICLTLIRSISRPLQLVQQQLQELASGDADLSKRLPASSGDEVGHLSRSFNTLMDNLSVLVRQVQTSGIQVSSSSTSITAFTKELEAAVSEQVSSTNEVVATATEISATSQDLASTMNDVVVLLQNTAEFANRGQKGLVRMEAAMYQMEEASKSIAARLGAISEQAQKIGSVVTTISKVAGQTNLLSFNAAIEAEKAGEFGQGFAVVAREIRRLSDQTDVATLDIEKMVKEMGSAVSAGVMGMDKFSEQVRGSVEEVRNISTMLTHIIEQVQALSPRFEAVSKGMQSQAIGAQQIKEAMIDLSEAARQTSESLHESTLMIEQLNKASQGLHKEVGRFKVN